MKQGLQIKPGQSLAMTPQLQQAIRLLQLSALELDQEIQNAVESNPMLEFAEDNDGDDEPDPSSPTDPADSTLLETPGAENSPDVQDSSERSPQDAPGLDDPRNQDSSPDDERDPAAGPDTEENWLQHDIPEELPIDSTWEDIYVHAPASVPMPEDYSDYGSRSAGSPTLADHLIGQLELTHSSAEDREIALTLIDALDADGLLRTPLEELAAGFDPAREIGINEIEMVLHRLQQFEPAGICARDLRECLLLQLRGLPTDTPWLNEARSMLDEHMNLLAMRDYSMLRRRMHLTEAGLAAVMRLVQTLNPQPGAQIGRDQTDYVIPDVLVHKEKQHWIVELNDESTPRLRINAGYAALTHQAHSAADSQYLRSNLREARWFLKSIRSRHETLLKVAKCIIEHQRGFLECGPDAMQPLVLADIAAAVDMHESTISRVTTHKYMLTPQGIFALKYFFSSHVDTADGGQISSTAIRSRIRTLTSEEDPRRPLSDLKIARLLSEQGIKVARRTVAKYRELMAIPPSNERKRLL